MPLSLRSRQQKMYDPGSIQGSILIACAGMYTVGSLPHPARQRVERVEQMAGTWWRFPVPLVMIASLCLAPTTGLAHGVTPETDSDLSAFDDVRSNPTPFGHAGNMFGLVLVINDFDPAPSELVDPSSSLPPQPHEQAVRIDFTVTNETGAELDVETMLTIGLTGNRGSLVDITEGAWVEGNNLFTGDTLLADGDSSRLNILTAVDRRDVSSLQLLAIAHSTEYFFEITDEMAGYGIWFDLGADEPFDPKAGLDQVEDALVDAAPGPAGYGNPTVPPVKGNSGDLVFELLDYHPNATDELAASGWDESMADGYAPAMATFRITNTGNRINAPSASLIDSSGFGVEPYTAPSSMESDPGVLMPGGSLVRTFIWSVVADQPDTRVLRLMSDPGDDGAVSWMLPDAQNTTFQADSLPVLADPISESENPVSYGSTASFGNLNVTISGSGVEHGVQRYVTTLAYAGESPDGSRLVVSVHYPGLQICESAQATNSSIGMAVFAMPGASMDVSWICEGSEDVPLQIVVVDNELGSFDIGFFARHAPD